MRVFLQFFCLVTATSGKPDFCQGLCWRRYRHSRRERYCRNLLPGKRRPVLPWELSSWQRLLSVSSPVLAVAASKRFFGRRGAVLPPRDGFRPWDQTCSDQQKSKWRGAIKRLTGLSLPASVPPGGSQDNVDRLIADGTRQLRYALHGKSEAAILAIHNGDYGFARNLCGVRWWWVALSLLCLVVCGTAFAFGLRPYLGLGIAGACRAASIFVARELPDYVKRCADRYTESLFASAILVSQSMDEPAKPATTATANKHS